MNESVLVLRGRPFDEASLRAGVSLSSPTANESAALAFCAEWLAGVNEFTLHTSGSTGTPKPIHLSRAQMESSARGTAAAVGLESGMRALICLSTTYIAGRMMLVRGLVCGMRMTLIEPTSNPLARHAEDFDFAALAPLQMEAILDAEGAAGEEGRARLNRAHAVLIGGAPVSSALAQRIAGLTAPCYHTYGMTETVSHVALRRMNRAPANKALAQATHVDDAPIDEAFVALPGVTLGLDERGCLRVRGAMTNGAWIQTNDLVTLLDERRFVWLGRADNVINSGGIKVPVEQLERQIEPSLWAFLGASPRFFVAGVPDERLGQRIVLVLEAEPLASDLVEQLLAALAQATDRRLRPRAVLCVPRFAETPTGKVDRLATLPTTAP